MQEPNNRNPENTMPLDPFAAAEAPVQSAETTYPVEADGEIHELTLDELIEAAAQGHAHCGERGSVAITRSEPAGIQAQWPEITFADCI